MMKMVMTMLVMVMMMVMMMMIITTTVMIIITTIIMKGGSSLLPCRDSEHFLKHFLCHDRDGVDDDHDNHQNHKAENKSPSSIFERQTVKIENILP